MKKSIVLMLSAFPMFLSLSCCSFHSAETLSLNDVSDGVSSTSLSSQESSDTESSTSLSSQELSNTDSSSSSSWNSYSSIYSEHSYHAETIIEHYYNDNGSLTQWDQSMAVYGDKAFVFLDTRAETANNGGYSFVVIDLTSKEIVFKGKTPTRECHNNNAQFLDTFYCQDDVYPLLLLSRGDYPSSENAGKCYVVRITENDNEYQLTIIKTINCSLPQAKYNGSWVTDRCGNLFLYTMTIGDWRTPESAGNRFVIYRFNMFDPLDFTELFLSDNDVIDSSVFDYCVPQGGDGRNGRLYLPIGSYTKINGVSVSYPRNIVAIVDPIAGVIEETIPSDSMENEGASIFGGKLYVSSKNVNGTSETTTPTFKIQSFELE